MTSTRTIAVALVAAMALAIPQSATATDLSFSAAAKGGKGGGGGGGGGKPGGNDGGDAPLVWYSWMHTDVADAWSAAGGSYIGRDVSITVVDDFSSRNRFFGNLTGSLSRGRHGDWVADIASMTAPGAAVTEHEFSSGNAVALSSTQLDVINVSYLMIGAAGQGSQTWNAQEQSIVDYAWNGSAVISKAAGNDGIAMGGIRADGQFDYLAADLAGAPAVIFVGASSAHGGNNLAGYSNYAGTDAAYNTRFLYVGVVDSQTGLQGTSFAAPTVSAYAAIVGEKFDSTDGAAVADQLLTTARRGFAGYDVNVHGMGEASLSNALAPASIN